MKTITLKARISNEDYATIKAAIKSGKQTESIFNDAARLIRLQYGDERHEAENQDRQIADNTKKFFSEYYRLMSTLITKK